MDLSILPPFEEVPGRQSIIDNAGRISKPAFVISIGVLFGTALVCVIVRFVTRATNSRRLLWDDGLVLLATVFLIIAFALSQERLLPPFYLFEAFDRQLIVPFREEAEEVIQLGERSAAWAPFFASALYFVKFAFLNFYHILIRGMPKSIARFYWISVGVTIICWIYTVCSPFIICPRFGIDAVQCQSDPNAFERILVVSLLAGALDVITDLLIVIFPLFILRQVRMSLARKLSLASMFCLSTAMMVCAFIRMAGTVTETRPDGRGAASSWLVYWSMVEACVAVIMTSVMVIRGAFLSSSFDGSSPQASGKPRLFRFLSKFGLARSTRESRGTNDNHANRAPRIKTQVLTRPEFPRVTDVFRTNNASESQEDVLGTTGPGYMMADMNQERGSGDTLEYKKPLGPN